MKPQDVGEGILRHQQDERFWQFDIAYFYMKPAQLLEPHYVSVFLSVYTTVYYTSEHYLESSTAISTVTVSTINTVRTCKSTSQNFLWSEFDCVVVASITVDTSKETLVGSNH